MGFVSTLAMLLLGVAYAVSRGIVTPALGLLLVVALLGFCLGVGILLAVYRLVAKLE